MTIQDDILVCSRVYAEKQASGMNIGAGAESVKAAMRLAYLSGIRRACEVLAVNDGAITPSRMAQACDQAAVTLVAEIRKL